MRGDNSRVQHIKGLTKAYQKDGCVLIKGLLNGAEVNKLRVRTFFVTTALAAQVTTSNLTLRSSLSHYIIIGWH